MSDHPSESSDPTIEQTRAVQPREAGSMVAHYRLLDRIGAGGMAEVYRAEDQKLRRTVAVKFLPRELYDQPELKERLRREAEATASLNHPNIVTVHDMGEHEGRPYIVMEYIEGQTLTSVLEQAQGSLSTERILDLAVQMADAFAAAHRAGIVHRDIKPSNILVDQDGRVRILDFGLAKVDDVQQLTQHGRTMGTPLYMSPEQTRGEEVDRRSDVFSFGLVLYELISGQHPFKRPDEPSTLYSIVHEDAQPLPELRPQLSSDLLGIVAHCLAKDPEERYQSFDALLSALRQEKRITDSREALAHSGTLVARPKRSGAAVVASILAVGVIVVALLRNWSFEFKSDATAVAQEASIAVLYFENVADPDDASRHARMFSSLLTTDLAQSSELGVTSRQRLSDIARQLDDGSDANIDPRNATQVARSANLRWMITGEILQSEPSWVITTRITDVHSGQIVASQRVSAARDDDLFDVVDELGSAVRGDLTLALGSPVEDRDIEDVTTSSPEAYAHYLEGRDLMDKFFQPDARAEFEKAVALDSTFAMAYYGLALTGTDVKENAAAAMRHRAGASEVDQLYIEALNMRAQGDHDAFLAAQQEICERYPEEKDAHFGQGQMYFGLGRLDEAVEALERVVELDPYYKLAHNTLAYVYMQKGEFEEAVASINEYIQIAPDEPNPYDSRGDIFAYFGEPRRALESYQRAVRIKSDYWPSVTKVGFMHQALGEFDEADAAFRRLFRSNDGGTRARGRVALATSPILQGRFREAETILEQGIAADRMEQIDDGLEHGVKHVFLARVREERGQLDEAAEIIRRVIDESRYEDPKGAYHLEDGLVSVLVRAGKLDQAEEFVAEWVTNAAQSEMGHDKRYGDWSLAWSRAFLEHGRGNHAEALELMRAALDKSPDSAPLHLRYELAALELAQGEIAEATARLETLTTVYDESRTMAPFRVMRLPFLLGQAYEASGDNGKAIEHYERFLTNLAGADPEISDVEDARTRLARLRS